MKKALSLALCLAMFVSIFAICTVSAEDTWLTAYDWETDTTGITDVGGETPSKTTEAAWADIGSTNGIKIKGGGYPYTTSYIKIAMTDELKSAKDIRVSMKTSNSNDSANPTLYGVVIDGVNYWHYIGGGSGVNTYKWYPLQTDYYEVISEAALSWKGYEPAFSLGESDFSNVEAILFNYGSSWGTCYIDDIQYVAGEASTPDDAPKATFDNGVADVEADAQGNVTLPTANIEGKQLFGWKDAQGNVYAAGAEVAITADTAFTAVAAAVELQTGAGIRWAEQETERGIRFETTVSKDALDALGSSSFELGALILPYANYDANITVETAQQYGAVNVVDPKVYGEVEDNYRYYTGVVDYEKYFAVSQAALADLKLTAVSYVKVTYADGSNAYFYDMPDATDNVRTVSEVARAALADTEFGYTAKQIEILELYNEYSEETTVPEYRKDDADKIQ